MRAAESCLTCKFWKPKYGSDLNEDGSEKIPNASYSGFCRRDPPRNESSYPDGYPDSRSDGWCGEYVKKGGGAL
jgi:hypothetical protein